MPTEALPTWDETADDSLPAWDDTVPIIRNEEKRAALLAEQATLRKEGEQLAGSVRSLESWERASEPFTAAGMLNQRSRLESAITGNPIPDAFEAGKPFVPIERSKGTGVGAGLYNLGAGVLEGLENPETLVTLPAAGPSRLVRSLFGVGIGKHLPDQVENAAQVLGTPEATTAQQVEAAGQPVVSAGMMGLLSLNRPVRPSGLSGADFPEPIQPAPIPQRLGIDSLGRPTEAFVAAEASGLRLAPETGVPVPRGGVPANAGMVELLAERAPEVVDVGEARNVVRPVDPAAYEAPGKPPGYLPAELAADVRQQTFEPARAAKVTQDLDLTEPIHPDKPLTANQLRIINDSLQNSIIGNRLSEERPGIISGTALENWADQQLSGTSSFQRVSMNPIGDFSARFAAVTIKGAAMLERGITDAAKWTAEMLREFGPEIRPYLTSIRKEAEALRASAFQKGTSTEEQAGKLGMRQFGEKVIADKDITDTVKSGVSEYAYTKKPNQPEVDFANDFIAEKGIDEAIREFSNEDSTLPGATKTILGKVIIRDLSKLQREATDPKVADALADRQIDVIDAFLPRSTDIAQALQSHRLLGDVSPEAIVRFARREFKKLAKTPEKSNDLINDKKITKEVIKKANEIQEKPEGFQRDRAQTELLDYIAKQTGLKWYELPLSYWYANILSGPATHIRNTIWTGINAATHLGLEIAKHPADLPAILGDMAYGLKKGGSEAKAVWDSGIVTGTRMDKLQASRPLELKKFTGVTAPLNGLKYVFRALSAEDMLFFKGGEELKAGSIARIAAKKEGLTGNALTQRVANILGRTAEKVDAAKQQAKREGLTGLDAIRRTNEIIEQSRSETMSQSARDYALAMTANNKPYGLLGAIANGVNTINREAVITRAIAAFVNIAANVTNEGLNYVPPVGYGRAIWGSFKGNKLHGKVVADKELLYDQYVKATVGTAAMASVAVMASEYLKDENPKFMVSGEGPRDPDRKKVLRENGWIPNSFKVGDRYVGFSNTPMAIPMAIMGNYFDSLRYGGLEETDAANRAAYALMTSGHVILQQSFLSGINNFLQTVNETSVKGTGAKAAKQVGATASGFVPYVGALRQVDRVFDPAVYSATDIESGLVNQTPFLRSKNRPALNALGEPIKIEPLDNLTQGIGKDPVWKALAEKQIWISVPDKEIIIGNKKLGADNWRALTPDEVYDYAKASGAAIKERISLALPYLGELSNEEAKQFVQKLVADERAKAKRAFELK